MTIKSTLISLICFFALSSHAQTIQFLFCGKTEAIATTDGSGKDQRAKSAIKLDFLKIGVRGASQTNPFYVLGNVESGKTNENFGDRVITDGCAGSNGSTGNCNQCTTCTNAISMTNANIGTSSGKFLANVRVESKGNDMFIMCTGVNNVVCYETHKISLAGQANKKLDVYYKAEGISALNADDVKNISLNYRFNNEAYFATPYFFNKNSSNEGVFEDVGSIQAAVPVSTEDLTKKVEFSIAPNPVNEIVQLKMTVFQEFRGFVNILNTKGQLAYFEDTRFNPSSTSKEINVANLSQGNYTLQISDEDGRTSIARFVKL